MLYPVNLEELIWTLGEHVTMSTDSNLSSGSLIYSIYIYIF